MTSALRKHHPLSRFASPEDTQEQARFLFFPVWVLVIFWVFWGSTFSSRFMPPSPLGSAPQAALSTAINQHFSIAGGVFARASSSGGKNRSITCEEENGKLDDW